MNRIVGINLPFSADIDDPDLPALEKVFGPQFGMRFQREHFFHRTGAAEDDAVIMRIYESYRIFLYQPVRQEGAAKLLRGHAFYLLRTMFESYFHIVDKKFSFTGHGPIAPSIPHPPSGSCHVHSPMRQKRGIRQAPG